jgi:hypothetical protein
LESGNKEILRVDAGLYKSLFRKEDRGAFSFCSNFWDHGDSLTRGECEELEAPFTEEEIKVAIFSCYPEGALGPDEIPFFFIKNSGM